MKISVLTIFPEMVKPLLDASILGRAQKNGILDIEVINIRDFADNKHHNTDDYPFGGGVGMLMMAQPIFSAFEQIKTENSLSIYLSPQGKVFNSEIAKELSKEKHLIFLCGDLRDQLCELISAESTRLNFFQKWNLYSKKPVLRQQTGQDNCFDGY